MKLGQLQGRFDNVKKVFEVFFATRTTVPYTWDDLDMEMTTRNEETLQAAEKFLATLTDEQFKQFVKDYGENDIDSEAEGFIEAYEILLDLDEACDLYLKDEKRAVFAHPVSMN